VKPTEDIGTADSKALDRQDMIAPTRSEAFQEMLWLAVKDSVDRDALARLFWLMNGHPRLLGHQRCLRNLLSLLSTPEFRDAVADWAGNWKDDIPAWIDAATWAGKLQLTEGSKLEAFFKEPRNEEHHVLMWHGVTRHPLAGALWIRHQSDPDPKIATSDLKGAGRMFRLLQWHFFCSQAQARHARSTLEEYLNYDQPSEWPAWPRPAAALGLAIRRLSHHPIDALLEGLPFETQLNKFAAAVVNEKGQLIRKHPSEHALLRLIALTDYFEDFKNYFEGKPAKPRRQGGGGGGGGGGRPVPGFIHLSTEPLVVFEPPEPDSGDEDVPTRTFTRVSIRGDTLDTLTVADRQALDLVPGEDLRPVMDLSPIEDLPGGIHGLWVRRQAIEAASQHNYWDRSQLTPFEVASLLDAIADKATDGSDHDPSARDAGLLLQCMLMFGCTAESARTTRSMWLQKPTSTSAQPEPLHTRAILVDPETGECAGIAVPAVAPVYASEPPEGFREYAEAAQSYLLLPDVAGMGAALLQHQRRKEVQVGGAVFSESPSKLEDCVAKILLAVNQKVDAASRPRLTTTKVSRKLPSLLSRAGLDEVGIALVCGDHRYIGQARLHYTQHQTHLLAQAYVKSIRRMTNEARRPLKPASISNQASTPGRSIGARLVVKTDTLQQLIGSMQTELGHMPQRSRSAWHRYHRTYILYTLVMQALITGIRPTLQPERLLSDFLSCDKPMGQEPVVVCVTEKDDQYEARSRPLLITDRLQRQFSYLTAHAQSLWRWQPVGLSTRKYTQAQSAFIDWDTDSIKPTVCAVGPHWIARELASHGMSAAANFTRAYLRTWMLQDGCPEQMIDALLGHAGVGQSPVQMHSTFDFARHMDEMGSRLENMSSALGLEPIPSRLADPWTSLATHGSPIH